jgi:hypothetical protein
LGRVRVYVLIPGGVSAHVLLDLRRG